MDAALPGGDLVAQGLEDLRHDRVTVESLLVSIGAPRLYALLAADDSDSAHGRYNALVRRLVSFERALSCAT
jgi:hypothetical protein